LLVSTFRLAGVKASFKLENGTIFEDCEFSTIPGQNCALMQFPTTGKIEFTKKPELAFHVEIDELPQIARLEIRSFLRSAREDAKALLDSLKSAGV
jgi:hypothetical protein